MPLRLTPAGNVAVRSARARGLFPVALITAPVLLLAGVPARAAEHVTLRNGYDLVCDHRVTDGAKTRLYLDTAAANYVEVATDQIASDESFAAAASQPVTVLAPTAAAETASIHKATAHDLLTTDELREVLQTAGSAHDLDVDLLASVVHAESSGHAHARSRVGAEGLMQLMPATAAQLGVRDSFAPGDNVNGGATYLGSLLTRYHDNLALALAAYNAGPAAVDRYHGIPPYRETRVYVARIIHEYNQRYAARQSSRSHIVPRSVAQAAAPAENAGLASAATP